MKRNCLKSTLAFSIVRLSIPVSLCLLAFFATGHLAGGQTAGASSSAIFLKVDVLITSDGGEPGGTGLYPDRYPKTIRVEHAAAFSDRIAAYGAAYRVWIAPKGWTGSAIVGADGSTDVDLHPVGSVSSGPRFHYEDSGGCAGCAIDAGAPYFPSAMRKWKEFFNYDTLSPLPPGLKIVRISQKAVTYSYSSGHDLLTRGAACFDPSEPFFEKAEFFVPHTEAKLLNFLANTFISPGEKYSLSCMSAPDPEVPR